MQRLAGQACTAQHETDARCCTQQGKYVERATSARDIDAFKLSSLHAQFKRKIRATIMELQEEQEQIESQNANFQELQDQVQGLSRRSRLGMDGPTNMVFLLLQEIM